MSEYMQDKLGWFLTAVIVGALALSFICLLGMGIYAVGRATFAEKTGQPVKTCKNHGLMQSHLKDDYNIRIICKDGYSYEVNQ